MPITFACPSCGKTLRVADAHAGKSIRCPHCTGVATAPAAEMPLPLPPPEPPPPPPRPKPLPPPPPPPVNVFEEAVVVEPAAKPRSGSTRGTEKRPPRERDRERDRDREPERDDFDDYDPPRRSRRWRDFAAGCGQIRLGLWIELGAVGVLTLIVLLASAGVSLPSSRGVGILVMLLYFGPLLTGTVFIAIGRIKLGSASGDTGAGGILGTAAALAVIRGIALLVALGFTLSSMSSLSGEAFGIGGIALFIALFCGAVAEMGVVTGMGVVAGSIPNDKLRRSAGLVGFVYMLTAIVVPILVLLISFAARSSEPTRDYGPYGYSSRSTAPRSPIGDVGSPVAVMLIGFVVQVLLTVLLNTMYGAGSEAGRRDEDEDLRY